MCTIPAKCELHHAHARRNVKNKLLAKRRNPKERKVPRNDAITYFLFAGMWIYLYILLYTSKYVHTRVYSCISVHTLRISTFKNMRPNMKYKHDHNSTPISSPSLKILRKGLSHVSSRPGTPNVTLN